ncbi:uncharacterized protein Z520_09490 [Fonsecaea multimorphosa CBS 102226]|uniref:Uncharacterized protein n=1 Tax=Fonsecaea multimorphosa CBS 102226 TaxID=1442371 RepID=A0A0D2GZ34_9EURO|nr:uncharacterized protein Z520_09490 [Fonsecaea multimorphosa CBS 102226]KIX94800.1 hypothetical protein Z520_09490 [Fonsecaea multimorphosa CBS 102226]OAL20379.1 hypothetical protein AYO22_08873 [Fonsecaea multimorphosa]
MRLQLLIQRHSLPPVTIIHTTGSGPASHTKSRSATIADLLADVNDLVPLESADGEWGLEDYAVEVAATADQHLTYECLHYQTLHSVLREDDEVVIRALSTEDLRVRRLGGRHQITGDGRHLIDGVAFGRQWLRKTARPGIVIPPRKKRRLLFDEDTDVSNKENEKRILPAADEEEKDDHMGALVPFANQEGEDDDDDDDYVDEDDADIDEPQSQVTVREDFDDADADSEDEFELNGGNADEHLSSELKHLLEDAAAIEQAANMSIALQVLDRKLKRKRDIKDDGEAHENETFEGFSSPIHSSPAKVHGLPNGQGGGRADLGDDGDASSDRMMREIAHRQAENSLRNVVEDDSDDSDDPDVTSSSDVTSSDSDADSMMEEIAIQQAKKRVLNLIRDDDVDDTSPSFLPENDESDGDISSTSESESESVESTSSESATSSDSESESESESDVEETKAATSIAALQTNSDPGKPAKPSVGIPFQGTNKTHYNNVRAKRRKRLNELKKQGFLPENAGFEELAKYESAQQQKMVAEQMVAVEQQADGPIQEDIPEVNSAEESMAMPAVNEAEKENVNPANDAGSVITSGTSIEPRSAEVKPLGASQIEPVMAVESAPKRARLDVASTRRLVFGSLGLRAPKNAEERQALREKLSQTHRQPIQQKRLGDSSAFESPERQPVVENDDGSWKNKLIVAAVECEEPGASLPPPPFPFEQGWARPAKIKRKLRDQSQYYQSRNDRWREKEETASAPDVSTLDYDEVSAHVSGSNAVSTLDGNSEDVPVQDIDGLPELEQAMILPGATVAYKELHVDASTNYQPEVSQYRIGQVSQVDEDGTVHLRLTKNSMAADSKGKIDPQTGQKVYGKFELANEDLDEGVDNGIREISISDMISAKLVRPSVIEVPDSNHVSGIRGGGAPTSSSDDQFAVIPESAEQDMQVKAAEKPSAAAQTIDTPRKEEINGIIKEAGFNSALDEELLQPMSNPASEDAHATSSPGEAMTESQGQYPHRFRPRSSGVDSSLPGMNTSSDVDTNANHDEGPGGGDATWSSQLPTTSSPYMPTQETVDYPHISQMDINSSAPTRTTESSTHQDAQKQSPAPALDLSSIASGPEKASNTDSYGKKSEIDAENREDENPVHSEDVPDPLASEVPESQSQKTSMPSQNKEAGTEETADRSSFLGGLGYDGQDSSYHDSGVSDDESDLPSLSELISSQRNRRRTRSLSKKVSPPAPSRKSLRNVTKRTGKSPALSDSPDLPALSQTDIKQSQSQRQSRLSEIPLGSPVVDLTYSSDPRGLIDTDDDSVPNYGQKKTKSEVNGRSKSAKNGKQDSGIGTRRLLTTKKVRNYY